MPSVKSKPQNKTNTHNHTLIQTRANETKQRRREEKVRQERESKNKETDFFIRNKYNTKRQKKVQLLYCSANKPAKEKENKRVVNPKNKKCLERLSKRLKTEKKQQQHTHRYRRG